LPPQKELSHLRDFIELEKIRLGDRVKISVDIVELVSGQQGSHQKEMLDRLDKIIELLKVEKYHFQ